MTISNDIGIGPKVSLNLQTRTLTRVRDGKKIVLPASACRCLHVLADAQGGVISQEELMEVGWNSVGVTATHNSIRVMINKLRQAFKTLELHDVISLLAVTRTGYRLIVRNQDSLPLPPVTDRDSDSDNDHLPPITDNATPPLIAENLPAPSQTLPSETQVPVMREKKQYVCILGLLAGLFAGVIFCSGFYNHYSLKPKEVSYVDWKGEGIPTGSEVKVLQGTQHKQEMISMTLDLYKKYVLDKNPPEKPATVLYVNLGLSNTKNHAGLIACQQPFKENRNECESFYFQVH